MARGRRRRRRRRATNDRKRPARRLLVASKKKTLGKAVALPLSVCEWRVPFFFFLLPLPAPTMHWKGTSGEEEGDHLGAGEGGEGGLHFFLSPKSIRHGQMADVRIRSVLFPFRTYRRSATTEKPSFTHKPYDVSARIPCQNFVTQPSSFLHRFGRRRRSSHLLLISPRVKKERVKNNDDDFFLSAGRTSLSGFVRLLSLTAMLPKWHGKRSRRRVIYVHGVLERKEKKL